MGALFQRGKKWGIDYYDPNGKRIRRIVSRYKETAQKALMKVEIQIAEGKYLDIKRCEPISFKDFAEKYRHKHIRRVNKSARNQEYLLNSLIKHFGRKMLHEISAVDLDDYLEQRRCKWSASTVNKDLTMLKSMFNRAHEWGHLDGHDPLKRIKKMKEENERCRFLSKEEQDRLLSVSSGAMRLLILLGLRAGLRWGEAVSLRWKYAPRSNYVDLEHNVIFIHEALCKSGKSRHVPLIASLKQAMMDYPQHSETGYIFCNPKTGKPFGRLRKSFKTALKRAEIEDFRFHDLRHCFASDLVRKGVDLFTVQKLLGHSSPSMTQRYAHLSADHLEGAVRVLDEKRSLDLDFGHHLVTSMPVVPGRETAVL